MSRANIFVIGLDEANLDTLRDVPHAERYRFRPLLNVDELQEGEIPVLDLLHKAQEKLDAFDGTIDAIVGYWDFPVSTLVPLLCERYGLHSTSLESIVKCEHKYWSRLEQQKVIDEHPRFGLVPLDEDDPRPPEGMRFPMWLKPVKSFSSELAFGVADMKEFRAAVDEIREGINRIGRPFDRVMEGVELPPEIEEAGGRACLAEEALEGDQVAVEGYVWRGRVTVYGVLDSINYPDSSTFLRHQYPSSLPEPVINRLVSISERVIRQMGMESATFSIEFFHNPEDGSLSLLEVNPRHSQSHAELFEFVDGVPNHHCMISLALGEDPRLPDNQGIYELSAKWYYRRFCDGVVRRAPTPEEVHRLESDIPGVKVEIIPEVGQRLSEMSGQDSYSYELAHLFIGADSEEELRAKYDLCVKALPFHFEDSAPEGSAPAF